MGFNPHLKGASVGRDQSGSGRKMRKRATILLVLVMILLVFSSSFAVELKPPPAKDAPATTPKPSEKPLPDLIVERVWLDPQCQINFQLKNIGKGEIADGDHSASVVRVQFGTEFKEFFLGKVDPGGALKKAGGFISFDTQILLKSPMGVKVIVDFNNKIKEQDRVGEGNNEKIENLTPQCSTETKGPQEISRIDMKLLPFDLAIDRIYLNDLTCKIHVVLRNLGTEKIPDEVYRIGKLKIISEHYKNVPSLPLSQVDPGKELNSGRRLKDFGTSLLLNSKDRVTFRFENMKDREPSNDSRTTDLIPSSRCLQVRTGSPAVVLMKPLPRLEPIKEALSPEIIRRTSPIVRPEAPEVTTPSKTGVSTSSAGIPSIPIISPSKGDILLLGSTFTIKWKVPEGANPWVAIELFVPGTHLTPSNFQKTWSYLVETTPNDGAYDWENISFSTPYQGPLQIRIRTIDGKVYGDSEIFSIGPPKEGK